MGRIGPGGWEEQNPEARENRIRRLGRTGPVCGVNRAKRMERTGSDGGERKDQEVGESRIKRLGRTGSGGWGEHDQ